MFPRLHIHAYSKPPFPVKRWADWSHYEMAVYGTLRSYANILGEKKAASLLQETLDEEKETDQKLTNLAEKINIKAADARASD